MGTKTGMAHLTFLRYRNRKSSPQNPIEKNWLRAWLRKEVWSHSHLSSWAVFVDAWKDPFRNWLERCFIAIIGSHAFPLFLGLQKKTSKSKQTYSDFLLLKRFRTTCSSKKTPKDNHESCLVQWLFSIKKRSIFKMPPPLTPFTSEKIRTSSGSIPTPTQLTVRVQVQPNSYQLVQPQPQKKTTHLWSETSPTILPLDSQWRRGAFHGFWWRKKNLLREGPKVLTWKMIKTQTN